MATSTEVAGGITPAAVEARLHRAPDWLADRRRAAWDAYTSLALPSSHRDEDWRRTDISALHVEDFVPEVGGETAHGDALVVAMRALRERAAPDAALIVNTRRGVRACDATDLLTAQGVIVGSLDEAAANHPELVQRGLAAIGVGENTFTALWNALWRGGCFVHVPTGVAARVPVWAAHTAAGDGAAVFPATVVVLEPHSSLTLVDDYASPAGETPMLSSAVTTMVIGEGARLDYCLLQRWGMGVWHMATHRAVLGRDARLRLFSATLGARLQKTYLEALLEGRGADAELAGVCFGAGRQHLDHQSLQAHHAPQTHSDLLLKVAVRDAARSVYSGLIDVAREAQQTDGYVQNRNLMLGTLAHASGIPRLEIRANDVRCSHGVTAGHLDSEQRFYLQSRGIESADAERLIIRGFMQDALDRAPHPGFRDLVADLLEEEIEGRHQAGVDAPEETNT